MTASLSNQEIYDQLMDINKEAFGQGHYEVAYHALAAALHCALLLQGQAVLTTLEQRACEQRDWIDTSASAHEIGEWMDDPYGANPTPAWGNIGQVSACQNNLEVGDPLSGKMFPAVKMSNGFTYHLQELAFLSWFYNALSDPSIGAGGKFSDNSAFKGPAKVCPPGGTF